jgi:hypothetical protein
MMPTRYLVEQQGLWQTQSVGRIALRAATVVVKLLASIVVPPILEQRRAQAEVGAVLSAFFSNEVSAKIGFRVCS